MLLSNGIGRGSHTYGKCGGELLRLPGRKPHWGRLLSWILVHHVWRMVFALNSAWDDNRQVVKMPFMAKLVSAYPRRVHYSVLDWYTALKH